MKEVLYYEVYKKRSGVEGCHFTTLEQCQKYIDACVILDRVVYGVYHPEASYEIIPHYGEGVKTCIIDEYSHILDDDIYSKEEREVYKKVLTSLG